MGSTERSRFQRPACRRCHARKVRCDAVPGRPCSGCRSAGIECVSHEKRRRNRGPPRPTTLPSLLPTPTPRTEEQYISDGAPPSLEEQQDGGDVDLSNDGLDIEIGRAAAALSSLQNAPHEGDAKSHLVEMLSQEDIDKRVMQKGVRIVYVGQEYSNTNYLIRHRARNEAVYHFPTNQISRKYTSHELDRIPREAFTMPSSTVVDELLNNYFRFVNPGFPVLDEQIFMSQYRNRDPTNPPSLLVLQAALMVGAHVSRNRPDRDELKATFFRRAKMLFDARFEWNRDVVVQAALLLTWHSEGVEDIGANSYYWVGIAARTALGLGMHRDISPSTLIAHDKRLWRRLWWILVQFDIIVSLSYGRPQAINLDDCDVPELQMSDFDLQSENVNADFSIHQTRLCCIMSGILRDTFSLRVSPSRRRIALLQADQKLAKWMASLPSSLKRLPGERHVSPWPAILHINYNNFLILLHRPPPKPASMASIVKQDDMEICSTAAGSMISLFEAVVSRRELRYMNVFSVDSLFTALIQLSAEMRVSNPVLSANAKGKFDSALEILHALSEYWLNAEIILSLFKDSSENMRQQLQIGESVLPSQDVVGVPAYSASEEDIREQERSALVEAWQNPDWSPTAAIQHMSLLNDQLDWTSLYWEQSGFPSLSPFADMGL